MLLVKFYNLLPSKSSPLLYHNSCKLIFASRQHEVMKEKIGTLEKSLFHQKAKLNLMTISDDSDGYKKKQPSWESIIISPDLIDNRQTNKHSDFFKKYLITKKVIRSNIQHISWISVVKYITQQANLLQEEACRNHISKNKISFSFLSSTIHNSNCTFTSIHQFIIMSPVVSLAHFFSV